MVLALRWQPQLGRVSALLYHIAAHGRQLRSGCTEVMQPHMEGGPCSLLHGSC